MTNKAYIVANEEQELCVLNEFEKRGYCWINDQGKPISSGVLIARELEDYPLFIGERFETKTIYWQDLSKLVNEEIVFDGRKEEKMSEKYVVSQDFIDELKEWKNNLVKYNEPGGFIDIDDLEGLPVVVNAWWGDEVPDEENNNRLIAIIRWVNGEDVFEVEKPKKWVVRSKETDDDNDHWYVRLPNNIDVINDVVYYMSLATLFNTKEEAQSWANAHQEVVEVVDV